MPDNQGVRFCSRCVNSDMRPNMEIDADGLCVVCRYAEAKRMRQVDWGRRRRELEEIGQWGRENSRSSYDCIVTVSGGKDSTRQALYVRDELGLKPLLVSCVYPPEQVSHLGAANLDNLISLGFDTISLSLAPRTWKKLMRKSFFKFANWCKSTELALYAIPIHVAIAWKIPLIFLGENPALTIGESEGSMDGDAKRMKYSNTLQGGRPDHVMTEDTSRKDVYFYTYPSDDEIDYAKLRIIYLGYYIEDFSGFVNAKVAMDHGLKVRHEPPEDIGDLWGYTGLDEDFRIVNQMIRHVKFGFSYVTDQVCEEIAAGRMTREQGVELVNKFDGKCADHYVRKYCDYLGISEDEFWTLVDGYRDGKLWTKDEDGQWKLRCPVR